LPGPSYHPWIVLEGFEGNEGLSGDLFEFALKRALTQFQEITVLGKDELEVAAAQRKGSKANQGDLPVGPRLRVSAAVRNSPGGTVLDVTMEDRGQQIQDSYSFSQQEGSILEAVDQLAQTLIRHFDRNLGWELHSKRSRYRAAAELLTADPDALRFFWDGATAWGRLERKAAEQDLRSALEIDPEFSLAHLFLAQVRLFDRLFDAALREVQAARNNRQRLTSLDLIQMEVFEAQIRGDVFSQRQHLRSLRDRQPFNKSYLYDLAESYFHTADSEDAIPLYLEVLKLDPEFALAYNHLGFAIPGRGDIRKHLRPFTGMSQSMVREMRSTV
jgi:tetratricopeptide (TPR) repeat protein